MKNIKSKRYLERRR